MNITQLGHIEYVRTKGSVSLTDLEAVIGYDYDCLMDLVLSGTLIRSEDDVISVNDTSPGLLEIFEDFRKMYPGSKRGRDVEFADFKRKHKTWRQIVPVLIENLLRQVDEKEAAKNKAAALERSGVKNHGLYTAPWKNLKTYLNQACWDEVYFQGEVAQKTTPKLENQSPTTGYYDSYLAQVKARGLNMYPDLLLDEATLWRWVNSLEEFEGRSKFFSTEKSQSMFWDAHSNCIINRNSAYGNLIKLFNAAKAAS